MLALEPRHRTSASLRVAGRPPGFRPPWAAAVLIRAGIVVGYGLVFCVGLPALLIATGLHLDFLVPIDLPLRTLQIPAGGLLVLAGIGAWGASALRLWLQGRGLPISHLPPIHFVASGPYRYVRHPLYIGFTALIAGIGLLVGSFWMLAVSVPLLVVAWISYALFFEEPILVNRFGATYLDYREQVGLFGPRNRRLRIMNRARIRTYALVNRLAARTVLLRRGRVILVTYGLFVGVGTLFSMAYVGILFLSQGWSSVEVASFIVASGLSAAVAGKLFWWVRHQHELPGPHLSRLRAVGFVSWGALAGMLLASYGFAVISGRPLFIMTDVVMASAPLCYALGRVGCLTYGCCYGVERSGQGVVYRCPEAKVLREGRRAGVPRYPTQLYSALHGAGLFVLLLLIIQTAPPLGTVTAVGFLVYGAGRFAEEFTRDRVRMVGAFTSGHLAALALLATGWLLLFFLRPEAGLFRAASLHVTVEAMTLIPVITGMAVLVFLVTSFHWKRIGTW